MSIAARLVVVGAWLVGAGTGCAGQGAAQVAAPTAPVAAPSPAEAAALPEAGGADPAPAPLAFHRTQDSQAWVRESFVVQAEYARVFAVHPEGAAPTTVTVGQLDLLAPPGAPEKPRVLPVTRAFRNLEDAISHAHGGDLVAVLPGRYAGFVLRDTTDTGDGRFIHVKALGEPGQVTIDAPGSDPNWMILLQNAHHVILQGFHIAGQNHAGDPAPRGPNAGILLDGDFVRSSQLTHHIAIVSNYSHGHKAWGIHSVDTHTVLVQDNAFADSAREHAAYFSDGSDDYVIRRNVFVHANACGLQINVDPLASLEKVARHPRVQLLPMEPTRAWAEKVLARATALFGENRFPDGIGRNFLVEDNVMNDNGTIGGAAINLAGVRDSLFQNNLVYGNRASGIAAWDNANPFDQAAVNPGPQTVDEVRPERLPLFGCQGNLFRNNTVLMSVSGRAALLVGNGSFGTRARNNVLVNDQPSSVQLKNTSILRFDGTHNVVDRVAYDGAAEGLKSLAVSLPDRMQSVTGVTRAALAPAFVRAGEEPWVLFEAGWWRLNPRRPDFHPRAEGLLAGRGDARELPATDLDGHPRRGADIGAYATGAR